ncbi:LptF/LptG family permease [Rappaport israeli]|uniref:LptF/LptG family permease n=1 Tax=Rappaport israeli TaxID=1839807 RepID=UPI0038CDBC95
MFAQSGHIDPHTTPPQLHLNNGQRLNWQHLERPETISLDQFQHAQLTLPSPQITASDRLRNLESHQLSQSPAHQSERQKRHNPALALLIFTLALPLLCQSKPRQSPYHKILPIFLLFSLYLNLLDTLTTLIKKTTLPAYPGSYSLHLLLLALTAYFGIVTTTPNPHTPPKTP